MKRTLLFAVTSMILNQSVFAGITYKDQGLLPHVSSEVFEALDIRMGTVSELEINAKAKIPSFRLVMKFGDGFADLKQSSAQLRDNYRHDETEVNAEDGRQKALLSEMQIAAVTNFPKRNVGIPSFFLTLGVVSLTDENTGTVVVKSAIPCADGAKVKLLNDNQSSVGIQRLAKAEYAQTFEKLDIRVGTVTSLQEKTVDFGSTLGIFYYHGDYPLFEEGMQVLRVINLENLSGLDNFLGIVNEEQALIPLTLERSMPNGRFLK